MKLTTEQLEQVVDSLVVYDAESLHRIVQLASAVLLERVTTKSVMIRTPLDDGRKIIVLATYDPVVIADLEKMI